MNTLLLVVASGDYLLKNRLSQNTEHPFVDSHSFDKTENNSYLLLERVPVRARCEVFTALLTDWDWAVEEVRGEAGYCETSSHFLIPHTTESIKLRQTLTGDVLAGDNEQPGDFLLFLSQATHSHNLGTE